MPTTIITTLDAEQTAMALEDLRALRFALDGARLVGNIGPRVRSARNDPNSIGAFRYLLKNGTTTKVTHTTDHHLHFVHEEEDGPTRRIELSEVLASRTSRKSLGTGTETALKAVRSFLDDLDPAFDPDAMLRIENGMLRLRLQLRIAMIETIGRRSTDHVMMPVAGRNATMSIWDSTGRCTWKLSNAGNKAVLDLAGSACVLTRKTAGSRDWKFSRRSVSVASSQEIDAMDAMERMRLMLEAQDMTASKPFRQVRVGMEVEDALLSAN